MKDFHRVEYGCALCPKENRRHFGEPGRLFGKGPNAFPLWLQGIIAHLLAQHPDLAKPGHPINDYLVASYF